MGVWGAGLYSSDFALDLRSTIAAVARLPFDGNLILDILIETEPTVSNDPDSEDHTTIWLVVADQFARRAIENDLAREKARAIIDGGSDLTMRAKLGMQPSDLGKRQRILQQVRARITSSTAAHKPRSVLKKPQSFLMNVGDVLVYPTSAGRCINPYFASKERDTAISGWKQDGWSACVIVDRGRTFDFLTWYRPLTLAAALDARPTLDALRGERRWRLQRCGTCSPAHFKRMELETIGRLAIDEQKLKSCFPALPPGTFEAIDNVSIANGLNVSQSMVRWGSPLPTIASIDEIST